MMKRVKGGERKGGNRRGKERKGGGREGKEEEDGVSCRDKWSRQLVSYTCASLLTFLLCSGLTLYFLMRSFMSTRWPYWQARWKAVQPPSDYVAENT